MQIHGHHRSHALAARHAMQIARQFNIDVSSITIDRRTARGYSSRRGRNFFFNFDLPPEPPSQVYEWIVNFTYSKSGKSLDIIVTAPDEAEAYSIAVDFLKQDADGIKIIRSLPRWEVSIAKGNPTNAPTGKAEYRAKS